MALLLDYDPVTKTRQLFHWNEADESFVIETQQDVELVAETSKAMYNQTDERTPWRGDFHHVARIPLVVWEQLVREGTAFDERRFRRWLDDSDNRLWRTRPGRVSK